MRWKCLAVLFFVLTLVIARSNDVNAKDFVVDSVPLPEKLEVAVTRADAPQWQKELIGAWVGLWHFSAPHVLIVQEIAADGRVTAISASGTSGQNGESAEWKPMFGRIAADREIVLGFARYRLREDGHLIGSRPRRGGSGNTTADMTRVTLASLRDPTAHRPWLPTHTGFVSIRSAAAGQEAALNIWKPTGKGPFRLVLTISAAVGEARRLRALFRGKRVLVVSLSLSHVPNLAACDRKERLAAKAAAFADIQATLAFIASRPDLPSAGRPLIAGVGLSGPLALAFAAAFPKQVEGAVSQFGTLGGCPDIEPLVSDLFGPSISSAAVRSILWTTEMPTGEYANNAQIAKGYFEIERFTAAYQKAGGRGEITRTAFASISNESFPEPMIRLADEFAKSPTSSPLDQRLVPNTTSAIDWRRVLPARLNERCHYAIMQWDHVCVPHVDACPWLLQQINRRNSGAEQDASALASARAEIDRLQSERTEALKRLAPPECKETFFSSQQLKNTPACQTSSAKPILDIDSKIEAMRLKMSGDPLSIEAQNARLYGCLP